MQVFFVIGGVVGWLVASMLVGHLLPVLSLWTFIAVFVGGLVGVVAGVAFVR